jgi:cytochrome c oxidase assembly protein subunit 15
MAVWLFGVAAMVFAMIIIGGLTRLTDSGLSMVHWQPVTGWLPPLSEDAWHRAFDAYRQFPEYQKINAGMTLAEFQGIFWLEYIHRLWGRLIGVAFAVPLLWFLIRGRVDRRLGLGLAGLFVLGAVQGVLGWWMVTSGLVDRPDVSQYRLVVHLSMALLIYALLLWLGLSLWPRKRMPDDEARGRLGSAAILGLVLVTALAGGFVAGLDAGLTYNTFPLMDGRLIPAGLFAYDPWYRSFFEDITTAQFVHRWLAVTTVAVIGVFWLTQRRSFSGRTAGRALGLLALATTVQAGLGIATLLLVVPVSLAALHQAGAVVLWTAALWFAFETRRKTAAAAGASATDGRRQP